MNHPEQDNTLSRMYADHPQMLYDLLEVCEKLEGQAAQLAASRATDQDIFRISKAYRTMSEVPEGAENQDLHAQLDFAFHRSIYEASHNSVLIHTLQNLMKLMQDSVLVSVNNLYHRRNAKAQIDDYHRLIFNAIVRRDPQRAEHAAMDHIRDLIERIREIEQEEQRLIRASAIISE